MLRNRKAEVCETVIVNEIDIDRWKEYFQQLHQGEEEQVVEPLMLEDKLIALKNKSPPWLGWYLE